MRYHKEGMVVEMFAEIHLSYLIAALLFATCAGYIYTSIRSIMSDPESRVRQEYLVALVSVIFSCLFYGLMTIAANEALAKFFWAIAFMSYTLFLPSWIRFSSNMVTIKSKPVRFMFRGGLHVITVILIVACVLSNSVVFVRTDLGIQFSYNSSIILQITAVFVFILCIIIYVTHFKWWLESKVKRHKRQQITFLILTLLFAPIGYMTDYYIPSFTDATVPPLVSLLLFPAALQLFISMRINRTLNITVPNVSAYVFKSLTIPTLVLSHNNNIGLENDAARAFFGGSTIGQNITEITHLDGKPPENSIFNHNVKNMDVTVETPAGTRLCDLLLTVEYDKFGDALCKVVLLRDKTESEHKDTLLQAVNQAAVLLLTTMENENIEIPLKKSMELVARAIKADGVHIWRLEQLDDDDSRIMREYSWFSEFGGGRELDALIPSGVSNIGEGTDAWLDALSAGVHFSGPISKLLLPDEMTHFNLSGLKSIAIIPLFLDEQFWGMVSIDDCVSEREFSEEEINILKSLSLMMASAINRHALVEKRTQELNMAHNRAREASRSKSNFLANMSHEIRTPMNVIVGLTGLLMEEDAPMDEVMSYLQKINSAGVTLVGLVNDILDISKIESGKFTLTPTQYEMSSLLNDIVAISIFRIREKPISFVMDIDEDLYEMLYGDDLRLKQILINLLSNAFKYTRWGTITLSVRCEREDENYVRLSFDVADTGIGIRPENLEKLFSDYSQIDTQANRMIEGTGLGLSITKGLTELMDGEITVKSEYGRGSVFSVNVRQGFVSDKLICEQTKEDLRNFRYEDNKRISEKQIKRPDLSWARVLVVDDAQTNLDVAKGVLSKYKMKVDCVTNGQDAINHILLGKPVYDAVFMDHMMPGMDGIEAASIIRSIPTKYAAALPIIALTANAIAGNEQMFLEEGFQAFLSKPISISKVDAVVRQWVMKEQQEPRNPAQPERAPAAGRAGRIRADIPGVNMKLGLSLYEDDMEIYTDILRSFVENVPAEIGKLRGASEERLPNYAINIHTMKGVCSSIGAEELSARAKKMEAMANDGDFAGIASLNETFIKDAEALVDDIRAWLTEQ